MKLPKIEQPQKYTGLYVVDFGDHAGVGFTAREVAELLESEKYSDCKVYKIHAASPEGQMELRGIRNDLFSLEAGMFFYASTGKQAEKNFTDLVSIADNSAAPCSAKVHLVKYAADKFAVALIYPAEYNDEISDWLLHADYKTASPIEGGIEAVSRYYADAPEILDRRQLTAADKWQSRTGEQLLQAASKAVQR